MRSGITGREAGGDSSNNLFNGALSKAWPDGETYLSGDSREIREKCELILRNLSTYEKSLHQSYQGLNETYGEKRHEEMLTKIYKKLLGRRRRLHRAKLKKANFLKRKKKA